MLQMARLFLCAFILISPIFLGLAHAATCEDGYYLPDGTTECQPNPEPEFIITTIDMVANTDFTFKLSAAGTFYIDWGDGTTLQVINKENTDEETITHVYETGGVQTIKMSGQATAYITGVSEAAVSFSGNENIVSIDGSLGAVFGTLSDGTNPLFLATFSDCVGLTSIPDDLFSGITGFRRYMFTTTFNGCTGLTSIPENLFSGITGSAPELFFATFSGCTGLTSIPEKLFSGISGAASSMFSHTFRDCEFLKSIPDKLFSTVSGAAATMFHGTFSGCTGLTSIPENLFSGITGPAESMFWYTFSDCTGLTSIPEKLFSGISGTASGMFMTTFNNCTSLTEIPENLFSGITEGAYGLFSGTFSDCTALKSIPENLFSNISSGALQMFSSTFAGCSSLTSIPGRLFSNVKASAEYMFDSTFSRCSALTQIGDSLFGGISDGAKGLFSYTFSDCDSLSNIPGTLFKNLSGAAESMFAGTFSGCDGLRTVPGNLFGKITSVVPGMFSSTFNSCQNLTSIPVDLFASIASAPADSAFYATFAWSENIKEFVDSNGQSVSYIPVEFFSRMSKPTTYNKNMFEYVFAGTNLDDSCPSGTIKATPYYANEVAPKVVCEVFEPNVKITTTDMVAGSYFILSISATGEFLIDWNDGTPVQKITKTNTNEEYFYHIYETSGVREIGISGQATSYSSAISAVISFNNNTYIRSVDGSLGAIFGGNAVPYMFYQTFSYCENLENISDDLFDGISGVANSMFNSTFSGCRKLTEIPENLFRNITNTAEDLFGNTFSGCAGLTEIPENLFGGISGQPATSMFSGTFSNCENLTEIPAGLFEKISGAAYNLFGYTFSGCQNLTQIPSGLFSSISGGAQEMFAYTFDGCTGITKIPTGLFDGINVAEYGMFMGTFNNCIGLTGDDAIPSDLFSGITSANTSYLFNGTFAGCIGLTKIPSDLFSNIEGAGAGTFYGTFSGCVGLTEIPSDLFKSIQSIAPQETFAFTFSYCTGLETLPVDLFPNKLNLSGAQYPFMGIFDGATNISTITLTDGTTVDYIPREFFTNMTSYNSQSFIGMFNSTALATACPSGTASDSILSGYLSPKAVCFNLSDPEFIITTTSDTTDFRFSISATGEYIIDWGDGSEITQITKNQAEFQEITHQYDKAMQYQIKMWGDATAYHSWLGAVSFSGSQNIETVSGSLGKIFGSLNDGKTQPLFTNTFSGCSNLTEIPNTLFDGIYGTPADFMFENTFSNCESLTRLPGGMFKNLYGAPSASMFAGTFAGCTGLTELPGDLFDGILAASRNQFSHTFSGCTGLTELPENLFSSLKRNFAPYMFYETFNSCSSLKTLPAKLFASLSGNLREATFMQTFLNCTGLETIPDELFATVSATGPDGFNGTFENCTALTTIPVGLFKSIVGRPSSDAFESVFYNATNLARFVFSDGKTVSFIPISFWDELSLDGYSESAFTLAFTGTKLAEYCPSGSRPADVSYANEVAPKVVCIPAEVSCAPGEYISESGAECQQCPENNICRGDWSEPESCHDLTNGEYPYSDAGRSDISDCYRTCDEYSLDECNLRPIDKFKAYYGEQCEYSCKTNNGFLCDIIDNQCHEIMCPNAYEYINGECVPCTRDHAIAFKDAPGCKVDTCEQDYYPDDEICTPDTILCSAPHAQTAVQEWDNNKKLYGKCMILECVSDWHVESNACVPDEESCEIANGTGVREWNHQTNSWGECIATRCDPGYINDASQTNEAWNQCGRCNNAYSADGELAVSSYVNECEIASCLYQGELYTLENNECRLICDEYSDETGRRYWNDITKKCIQECAAGYANW